MVLVTLGVMLCVSGLGLCCLSFWMGLFCGFWACLRVLLCCGCSSWRCVLFLGLQVDC